MNMNDIDSTQRTALEWRNEAIAAEVITSNFIPLNIWMIKFIGLDATLFLSAAYEEFLYLRTKNKTYTQKSIIFSKRKAQQKTGLGEDRQKKAIAVLKGYNLINCTVENGIPKKRIIGFNFNCFCAFKNGLDQFIKSDVETTRSRREKFNEKMMHIREAVWDARGEAEKIEWLASHPDKNYEDYININDLPF